MTKSRLPFVSFLLLLFVGCSSYYSTVKQTPLTGDLKSYRALNVGWLDLGEEKYKNYGYEEKDKATWFNTVSDANLKGLPQYLKEYISDRAINVVKAKGEMPTPDGLVILFTDVNYNQQTSSAAQVMFGSAGGSDTLDVTVHFVDGRSGKEIYAASINITSKAGMGYSSMGFEGRVNNTVYNLARFISEKIQ